MSDDKAPAQCFKLCSSEGVPCTCTPTTGWNYIPPAPHIEKSANSRHDTGDVSKNAPTTSQLKETGDELKAPVKSRVWKFYEGDVVGTDREFVDLAAYAELEAQLAAMTEERNKFNYDAHYAALELRLEEAIEREAALVAALKSVLPLLKTSTDLPDATAAVLISPAEAMRRQADAIDKRDRVIVNARNVLEANAKARGGT